MTFGASQWFWVLLIIPILGALFARAERRAVLRLREFVSERLLPNLARTVDRRRRLTRFVLVLCGLTFAIAALAQPRWGYIYEDAKRKGLDLILAVDTSRSMLSNDVPPNRLERVKLATQDLINELQGDRVGLIAFAGRAFLQAPLTIDYGAAVEAINDLDTNTIPEGGSNISQAIDLAVGIYGKSAIGNRALIIFTDGEELDGDGQKTAKAAADAGVRIFTVGVGTPEGSLIPINGEAGGTAFVKDGKGQVVKSRLDEKRLKEIAEKTGGFYLHLDGARTMKQLFSDGLARMQAGDIDARLSRRPIERYQWPLGAALFFLAASFVMRERRRLRAAAPPAVEPRKKTLAMAAALLLLANACFAAAPGLEAYRQQKFSEAYKEFEKTLKEHPRTGAADKIQFDAGAAAYKMKEYGKALNSFSQALLSPDAGLQGKSHYNLGNTLYQRGETQKKDDAKLKDWTNALQHYEQSLKITPENKEAQENLAYVKKKIEELKQKREQQPPPSPSPKPEENKKNESKKDDKDKQQQQNQKDQTGDGEQEKPDKGDDEKSQPRNESGETKEDQSKANETPSPSPGENDQPEQNQAGPSPSPSAQDNEDSGKDDKQDSASGDQDKPGQTPTPSDKGNESSTPSSGKDEGTGTSPTPAPASSPEKKLAGEVKSAGDEQPNQSEQSAQVAQAEPEKDGQMSEKQAELLLQSMKDEERRVQLDERKVSRNVYRDW